MLRRNAGPAEDEAIPRGHSTDVTVRPPLGSATRSSRGELAAVTVVVPTRDRRELLLDAVRCVLAQVGVVVRVLVVDDGSSTPVSTFLPDDPRVRVVRKEDSGGVSGARNTGLELAETPWLAFLDDDDVWSADKLRRQLQLLEDTGHRWACSATASFTDRAILDIAEPPGTDDVSTALLHGNYIPGGGSGVLVETSLARDVGGFDTGLASLADWDLWIRLAQRSPVARVRAVDVGYRVHPTSMAHDVSRQERELRAMQHKYRRLPQPLQVEPDDHFLAYWARLDYRSGHWRSGWARTFDLSRRHGPRALVTPAGHALPEAAQRWLRARRVARRLRHDPELDVTWLVGHLTRT